MTRRRRKHSPEFKREAVRLLREEGRTVREVAHNLGVSTSALWRWKCELEEHGDAAFPGSGVAISGSPPPCQRG